MSDRLDDALRDLARVDAPADLARRVQVRLDAGTVQPSLWPRLAAIAAAVLLLVAGLWMAVSIDRGREDRMAGAVVGGAEAPSAQVQGTGPAAERHVPVDADRRAGGTSVQPPRDTTGVRGDGASVRAGGTSVRAGGASVRAGGALAPPTRDSVSVPDHDRALPALAQLGTIGPESLVSIPVRVDAREVAALAAIAPIEFPALGADEGERR